MLCAFPLFCCFVLMFALFLLTGFALIAQVRGGGDPMDSMAYHAVTDGILGPETKRALLKFQETQRLPPSGQIDGKKSKSSGLSSMAASVRYRMQTIFLSPKLARRVRRRPHQGSTPTICGRSQRSHEDLWPIYSFECTSDTTARPRAPRTGDKRVQIWCFVRHGWDGAS